MPKKNHPKPLNAGVAIAVVAIFIGAVPLLYSPYAPKAPTQSWLEDPEGDVEIIGEERSGIVDVTYVRLEVDEGLLKLTITVKDSIPEHLNSGEYAQWMATVILQDGVYKAYEVCLEMNSTVDQGELVGYSREIGAEEKEPRTVERHGNSLIISAPLDGLRSAKEIQWSISTTFEKWSGPELTTCGFDYAPDEGLQTTVLREA